MFTQILGPVGILTTGFWIWMIYDCVQYERDRSTWLWLLILLNFPGAFIYFIARWLPRASFPMPSFLNRWTRKDQLWQAEAAAMNIGKAHQFVMLGNIRCEMGDFDKAAQAYQQALEQEPSNPQALWGAASLAVRSKDFSSAKEHLQKLIQVDPEHKYGDASLAYGRVLLDLEEFEIAQSHLESHLRNWGTPEAYILMAIAQEQQGNSQAAREYLEKMIMKVRGAPPYHYRKNRHFVGQAERMLRNLGR